MGGDAAVGRGEREPQEAGVLVKNGPLHSVATATTVRIRGDEIELTDGPFAVTKCCPPEVPS